MKIASTLVAATALACVLGAVGVGASLASSAPMAAPAAGARVDDFQLTDTKLMAHQLYYYGYAPAIVLMSRSDTAFSRAASADFEKLAAAYKDKGVLFFLIDSDPGVSRDAVAAQAAKEGLTVPVLIDEEQLVGESLGVKREGEVMVIQPKSWKVAYRGPLAGGEPYTMQALDAVLAGKPAPTPFIEASAGHMIPFPARARAAEFARISYSKDVAPILQEKCATCHVNGGIGPFAMDSYQVIKGFSPMIRETVRTKRMPPYFADPHIGQFQHDQGLSAAQTKTLVHWIEAGALRGAGEDPLLVNKSRVAPEWPVALGKPDVIVDLPSFKVPASGIVEYQNQKVDNPFKENTWLRAISIKPGDRRVLHHVVSNWSGDASAPKPTIPGGSVGSYTPGAEAQVIAPGAGAPVPGGGKLNFQMHYTTFGKEATDSTKVGFYTLKEDPKYIKRSSVIGDFSLYIPAGEARHKEVAYMVTPADMYLYTMYPHSHYRGMHVELKAVAADGKETMLLALPKYDFNWQRDYDPVKPILIKAGTKLVATWVYDNSKYNKANPDATRNVTWGEQTPDEMMYFRINYRWADETVAKPRNDIQAKFDATRMLGALDDDMNGKISPDELRGPMSRMKPQFAALDKNHDGFLDSKEFGAVNAFAMARRKEQDTPDL